MAWEADQWMDALRYMEEETGQGGFDNVSLEELRWLYGRVSREFKTRKQQAAKGNVHAGWNDEYVK